MILVPGPHQFFPFVRMPYAPTPPHLCGNYFSIYLSLKKLLQKSKSVAGWSVGMWAPRGDKRPKLAQVLKLNTNAQRMSLLSHLLRLCWKTLNHNYCGLSRSFYGVPVPAIHLFRVYKRHVRWEGTSQRHKRTCDTLMLLTRQRILQSPLAKIPSCSRTGSEKRLSKRYVWPKKGQTKRSDLWQDLVRGRCSLNALLQILFVGV